MGAGVVVTYLSIVARMMVAGIDRYSIDGEHGFAVVFFDGRLLEETILQTRLRRQREFMENYRWTATGLKE
jgi:hypothetical protein